MKKLLLFLASPLLCLFLSINSSAQTNEQEPNNSAQKANVLLLNDSISGSISPAGDVDWFKVTTDADGRLDITVSTVGVSDSVKLQLLDSNAKSQLHDTIVPSNAIAIIMTDGLATGTYFIKLNCTNTAGTAAYKILDTLIKALEPNDPEPNNTWPTTGGPTINLNDTISGHIGYAYNGKIDEYDFFPFATAYDGNLSVTVKNNSYTNTLFYELFDDVYNLAGAFNNPGEETTISFRAAQSGRYYIGIIGEPFGIRTFGSYSFTVHLDSAKHPNDIEPNNQPAEALSLGINSEAQGHTGYYHNASVDTTDWYKLILPLDGMVKLNLSSDSINSATYFSLYDADAKTVLKKGFVNPQRHKSFLIDGLAAGKYFIKIYDYRPNLYTTYTLQDSLLIYTYSADTLQENNNQPYLGKDISANQTFEGHVGFYNNTRRDTSDWWKVDYNNSSGQLQLFFNLLPSLIDKKIKSLAVQLFSDTLSNSVYSYSLSDSLDTININNLQQGVYYIKINCGNDSNWCAYSFKAAYENVLATTFLSFSGSLQNNVPVLKWQTTNEANCKGFEVQRSNNGNYFNTISFVNSKGNAPVNNYSFTDNANINSESYYRLKETDNDGGYRYSSTIRLNENNFKWYIAGNANDTKLFLKLNTQTKVGLQVTSLNGTVITVIDKGTLPTGDYVISLNLNNQPSGIYSIKLLLNEKIYNKQFFKL